MIHSRASFITPTLLIRKVPIQCLPLTAKLVRGIVVSFFTGGAFCGAGLAGPAGDRLGRRWTIFIGSIIFLLGGALQTGAMNLHYMWAGRWLSGLGVGFLVMIIPIYQSEIAHPSIRGRITVCLNDHSLNLDFLNTL